MSLVGRSVTASDGSWRLPGVPGSRGTVANVLASLTSRTGVPGRLLRMAPTKPRDRPQRSALLGVLLVASFLVSADSTITNVATPSIRASLGASGSDVQFVVSGYLVAYAVLLITGARLGESHGYKSLFLTGIAGFGTVHLSLAHSDVPAQAFATCEAHVY